MEHRNEANNTNENVCPCKNGYKNTEVFLEKYGTDDSLRNCSSCPNFSYVDGIGSCKKFN